MKDASPLGEDGPHALPPQRFGEWTVERFVHEGGNARVYSCRNPRGQEAALKLPKVRRPESERYRRFRDEVRVLRDLGAHPGVLPLIDARVPERPTLDDPAYLVMPLATRIDEALQDAELEDVVVAVAVIAETLGDLGSRSIFHRDVKPGNLYRYLDSWVVGDFGLADYPDKEAVTAAGRKLGPAYYHAPEMLNPTEVADPGRADVYSLIKTLWVLATGQSYPIVGEQRRDTLRTRIGDYRDHPRTAVLDRLVEQATWYDPARRPTMHQVAAELRAWLARPAMPAPVGDLTELADRIQAAMGPEISQQERRSEWIRAMNAGFQKLEVCLGKIAERLSQIGLPATGNRSGGPNGDFGVLDSVLVRHQVTGDVAHLGLPRSCVPVSLPSGELFAAVGASLFDDGSVDFGAAWAMGEHNLERMPWSFARTVQAGSAEQENAVAEICAGLLDHLAEAVEEYLAIIRR